MSAFGQPAHKGLLIRIHFVCYVERGEESANTQRLKRLGTALEKQAPPDRGIVLGNPLKREQQISLLSIYGANLPLYLPTIIFIKPSLASLIMSDITLPDAALHLAPEKRFFRTCLATCLLTTNMVLVLLGSFCLPLYFYTLLTPTLIFLYLEVVCYGPASPSEDASCPRNCLLVVAELFLHFRRWTNRECFPCVDNGFLHHASLGDMI